LPFRRLFKEQYKSWLVNENLALTVSGEISRLLLQNLLNRFRPLGRKTQGNVYNRLSVNVELYALDTVKSILQRF
jgi:hypothetical protein